MALADILRAIDEEADAEIRRIDADADERARADRERAGAEAARIEEIELRRRRTVTEERVRRIVTGAHVDADRAVRAAREAVYQELLVRTRARLEEVPGSAGYGQVLALLFDECRRVLPEGRTLRVRSTDADRVTALALESGMADAVVDGSLEAMGGLELESDDGRRVLNTLDERLDKADRHLRLLAGELLPGLRGSRA